MFSTILWAPQFGTRVLQVPKFYEGFGDELECISPQCLQWLCEKVGVWTCKLGEEGLGNVARCFWVEGLNLCQILGTK
jgi:hypothetical protein